MRRTLFFFLLLCVFGCSASRTARDQPIIRVMTYNIHHGEGTDGKVDLKRIAEVIKRSEADIVALQEVDRGVERTKRIDIMTELSDLTGMTYAFGKNIDFQAGEYGNGFLTRFPILEERNHHYRMIHPGEQRGLLQLVLEVHGEEIVVMNTHIDYRQDDTERIANIAELRSAAARYAPRPVVVCGDFNDTPESRTIALMKEDFIDAWEAAGTGAGFTYPADTSKKRIDYIFVSKPTRGESQSASLSLRPVAARVVQSDASDHLPLLVEFELTTTTGGLIQKRK
jgi:endonuclease/exonuclease/phosphatase family metal-dependent hydrolase